MEIEITFENWLARQRVADSVTLREAFDAGAHSAKKELAAIHAITLCIACVKEVDKTAPYTVQAVQQMAVRINELEKK